VPARPQVVRDLDSIRGGTEAKQLVPHERFVLSVVVFGRVGRGQQQRVAERRDVEDAPERGAYSNSVGSA